MKIVTIIVFSDLQDLLENYISFVCEIIELPLQIFTTHSAIQRLTAQQSIIVSDSCVHIRSIIISYGSWRSLASAVQSCWTFGRSYVFSIAAEIISWLVMDLLSHVIIVIAFVAIHLVLVEGLIVARLV